MLRTIRRLVKFTVNLFFLSLIGMMLLPFLVRGSTAALYRGKTHTVATAPEQTVAVIFGARAYSNGRLSAMLADRVETGVDLYNAGKVDYLLMSGDSGPESNNEPEAMRQYAIARGVPSEAIIVDPHGRRSYDTCYRAHHVYGVEDAILVTQNFHLDRTLLLCNTLGIQSVGVFADYQRPWGYSERSLSYSRTREFPATMLAVADLIRREPPPSLQ